MNKDDKRFLIERYLDAYNAFDIDGMMSVIHPDIVFQNVSGGEVNATASGANEFRKLAEQSKGLFSARTQTITSFETKDDQTFIGVDYEGVIASDLPNGMKAGETLRLNGRSEFDFRDGKIYRITDIS
ncbi:MAG: nuclear transport factor 2 family protein [Pseudomonadota bacterium]